MAKLAICRGGFVFCLCFRLLGGEDAVLPPERRCFVRGSNSLALVAGVFAAGTLVGLIVSQSGSVAHAQRKASAAADAPSPVGARADRDVYYPGSEALAPDEMRVVCLGSGMPNARPKQAAACWLVELGNGDKFLFDIGSGSAERISAMKIPYDYLDKVFIGHGSG